MINVSKHIDQQLRATRLEILVFGPAVDPPSIDPYVASLQKKRQSIKDALIAEGHIALFGEEVVDASLPSHLSDPLLQEISAMRQADLIIVLVQSPGAIMEAATISREKDLCGKSSFFCYEEHKDGLVVQHLRFTTNFGSTFHLMSLSDVDACHLTTAVLEKVRAVQVGKTFLF